VTEEPYKSPPTGNGIRGIFHGVSHDDLKPDNLTRVFQAALSKDNFTILESKCLSFPYAPGCQVQGCTAFYVLGESHLSAHTYPEHSSMVVDLYTCRGPDDGRNTLISIIENISFDRSKTEITQDLVKVDPNMKYHGRPQLIMNANEFIKTYGKQDLS
jgi:S-adenosylmethionine decarboxylase